MSNTIQISGKYPLILPLAEIDTVALKQLMKQHQNHNDPKVSDWFCWFVKDNMEITKANVQIYMGQGRSVHTSRNFQYTLNQIENLLRPGCIVPYKVEISDESDGFQKYHSRTIFLRKKIE